MKHIQNILPLMLILMFASCSSNEEIEVNTPPDNEKELTIARASRFKIDEDSKAYFVYNYSTGEMDFDWQVGDVIGISATARFDEQQGGIIRNDATTDLRYTAKEVFETTGTYKSFQMERSDGADFSLDTDFKYTSYYPMARFDVANLPKHQFYVTYRNQRQASNVNMKYYYRNNDNYESYIASEKAAAAHLTPFDYMISSEVSTGPHGGASFPFEHIGSIVRFFLRSPREDAVGTFHFSKIRVVADKPVFYKDIAVDISDCSMLHADPEKIPEEIKDHHLTPKGGSPAENYLELTLGTNETPYFEMNYQAEGYTDEQNYSRYFVAYMMLTPVDLSDVLTADDKIYLYLEGVKVEGLTETPVYYRSQPLEHKNFRAGYVYQWQDLTIKEEMEPILLEAISVEKWLEGTAIVTDRTGSW